MKNKLIIIVIILAIIGVFTYNYMYKKHRDVSTTDASSSYTTTSLLQLFTDNDVANDLKALDQIILINGVVTGIDGNQVILDDQIVVQTSEIYKLTIDQQVVFKGRCLGYDDLMGEIKIDQAILQP